MIRLWNLIKIRWSTLAQDKIVKASALGELKWNFHLLVITPVDAIANNVYLFTKELLWRQFHVMVMSLSEESECMLIELWRQQYKLPVYSIRSPVLLWLETCESEISVRIESWIELAATIWIRIESADSRFTASMLNFCWLPYNNYYRRKIEMCGFVKNIAIATRLLAVVCML